MNKKAFTLVELLAIITILALLMAMVVIGAKAYFNRQSQKEYDNIKLLAEENTKVLVNTNQEVSKKVNTNLKTPGVSTCKILYSTLVAKNLMDSDTKNPVNKTNLIDTAYVKITLQSNYEYSYEFYDTGGDSLINCLN